MKDKPIGNLGQRLCHDCKRPTTDYRCPECRAKWKKEHKVSGEGVELYSSRGPVYHNGIGME